jgi:Xaa-Pro aminopeptidase
MKKLTRSVLLIGSSFEASDVQYASGFKPLDPVVFLSTPRKKILVVSMLEQTRARKEAPGARILTPSDLSLPRGRRHRVSAWAVALLKQQRIRRVTVGALFPHGMARTLQRAGVRLRVDYGPLFPERERKSPREIKCIAQSQRAAVAAMRRAIAVIAGARVDRRGVLIRGGRPLTSEALRREIDRVLLDHQTYARETIVAGGRQAVSPHERGHGPLKAGQPIVIDIFPQHRGHGYWGDLTRTVVKGRASPELKNMYEAVRAAQAGVLRRLRAGAPAAALHAGVQDLFRRLGYETRVGADGPEGFFHGTGHGVGLDIHEAPSISVTGPRLKAGQVVTVEPGLYYYRLGGIRIEDTVVVTRRGWRYLCRCPHVFEV